MVEEFMEDFKLSEIRERSRKIIEGVLQRAQMLGVDAAEASYGHTIGFSVKTRKGELESLEHENDRGLSLTVFKNRRTSSASSSDLCPKSVEHITQTVCKAVDFSGEDSFLGLADEENLAKEAKDLDLDHPKALKTDEIIDLVREAESLAIAHPKIVNSEGAYLNTSRNYSVYGNTNGFLQGQSATYYSGGCYVVGQDRNGGMQRDGWFSSDCRFSCLQSMNEVAMVAQSRTLARLGAKKIRSCRPLTLFSAEMAKSLFSSLISAIRGMVLYTRTSFLVDALGKQIYPCWLDILEEPLLLSTLGSSSFDSEGVATSNRTIVKNGELVSYVLDSYSARKMAMPTTGNAGGVRNLLITGQKKVFPYSDLLRHMQKGILITEMIGHGVNIINGDFSQGAVGFWIEDGEIAFPVEEITIAGNLKDIFSNIVALGDDVDLRTNIRTPSVLVEGMTVAGI